VSAASGASPEGRFPGSGDLTRRSLGAAALPLFVAAAALYAVTEPPRLPLFVRGGGAWWS